MNKQKYVAGDKAEVDEALLEELQKHNAVSDVAEKKATPKKASPKTTKAAEVTDESGE